MANKEKQGSFIMQAGILAAAGIICKIIGILYRSPLAHVIGDEGNGYYSSAYEIYTIILLVSSYSIPSAISKVIAHRLALGQYRNARKIFHCALMYVVVVGGAASILTLVFADVLVGGEFRAGTADFRADHFLFRHPWCAPGLFSGPWHDGSDLLFPDP